MMSDVSAATSINQSVGMQGGTVNNRVLQGLTASARALSAYGSIGGIETYNYGAFMTPLGPPCGEGTVQADGVGGAQACFVDFASNPSSGVDTFVGAMNASVMIGQALQQGQITVLAQALATDAAFGKQIAFFYGSNINLFASYLAIALNEVAKALGQQPEWYEGQKRVDVLLTGSDQPSGGTPPSGGNDLPSGGGQPAGGGTTTPASTEPEYSMGQKVIYWGAIAAFGYGIYKLATSGR